MHLHCLDNNNAIVRRRGRTVYHHFPIEFRNIITLHQSNILLESILFLPGTIPRRRRHRSRIRNVCNHHHHPLEAIAQDTSAVFVIWLCGQWIGVFFANNWLQIACQLHYNGLSWLLHCKSTIHSSQDRRGFFIVESLDNNNTLTSYQLLDQDRFPLPTLPLSQLVVGGTVFLC